MDKATKEELKKFQEFKKNYSFIFKQIKEKDGILYCDDIALSDSTGDFVSTSEKWINVKYNAKDSLAKTLSNLFPYTFEFRGQILHSIEAFFQGLKFPDADIQKLILSYSGIDAVHIQIANTYHWQESGYLYWQGERFKRDSLEYANLIDEVYISALQNPLYRQVLKNVDRYILHSIGKENKNETVFTRYEFELELNCLADFLKQYDAFI